MKKQKVKIIHHSYADFIGLTGNISKEDEIQYFVRLDDEQNFSGGVAVLKKDVEFQQFYKEEKIMGIYEMSIVDVATGKEIEKRTFVEGDEPINLSGGNGGRTLNNKMVFNIYGDFTIYDNFKVGKTVRFKADGFDENVKLLDMSEDKIIIETTYEVGQKLKASGFS
jgi:hypothetical protein